MHKRACDPEIARPFSLHSQFSSRNKTAGQDDRPAPLYFAGIWSGRELSRQLEVHRDLGLYFHRRAIEHIGFVLPLLDSVRRGPRQTWIST